MAETLGPGPQGPCSISREFLLPVPTLTKKQCAGVGGEGGTEAAFSTVLLPPAVPGPPPLSPGSRQAAQSRCQEQGGSPSSGSLPALSRPLLEGGGDKEPLPPYRALREASSLAVTDPLCLRSVPSWKQ